MIRQQTNEMENMKKIIEKVEEQDFKIKNLENERDLHHQSHIQLRKDLENKTNNEFQLNNLK